MEAHEASEKDVEQINRIIRSVPVAILTTAMPDGSLHSRPMATQRTDFDGELWFFTEREAAKVDEIKREHHVNVSYADHERLSYASLSGVASVVRDRAKAKACWTADHAAWLDADGPDDARIALLRVRVEYAEIWEAGAPTTAAKSGKGAKRARGQGKTRTEQRNEPARKTKRSTGASKSAAAGKGERRRRGDDGAGRDARPSRQSRPTKREGDPVGAAAGVVPDRRATRGSR